MTFDPAAAAMKLLTRGRLITVADRDPRRDMDIAATARMVGPPLLLPIDCGSAAAFQALGFALIESDDPLFFVARPPPGWRAALDVDLDETADPWWAHIRDDRGRSRVVLYHRGPLVDRVAWARLMPALGWGPVAGGENEDGRSTGEEGSRVEVTLAGSVIWRSAAVAVAAGWERRVRLVERSVERAVRAAFPRLADPLAYWDEETSGPVADLHRCLGGSGRSSG